MADLVSIAGLVFGAIAIIFSICIYCFNIITTARDFGEDYLIFSGLLDILELRFFNWKCMFLPTGSPSLSLLESHPWSQPHIRPIIEDRLMCVEILLLRATRIRDYYVVLPDDEVAIVRFDSSYESTYQAHLRFRHDIRRNQRRISFLKAYRWSTGDKRRLESTIQTLTNVVGELMNFSLSFYPIGASFPKTDTAETQSGSVESHGVSAVAAPMDPDQITIGSLPERESESVPESPFERNSSAFHSIAESTGSDIHRSHNVTPRKAKAVLTSCTMEGCTVSFSGKHQAKSMARHLKRHEARSEEAQMKKIESLHKELCRYVIARDGSLPRVT